jgi:spermidine synthase
MILLVGGMIAAERLTSLAEEGLYADEVIFAKSSPYQRIVITKGKGSFNLFLNGNLQFSSADEHRYHEALVHPAMAVAPAAKRVMVLGGGDGLAVREILKYPDVSEITLVDLDPMMTMISRDLPLLRQQNAEALRSPKVRIVNEDAYLWLGRDQGLYDAAIIDFPDPNNFALGKLYTTRFYKMLKRALAKDAPVVIQSTSPLMARHSFWCVTQTLEDAGFFARAFHVTVPSFGEWGYVLGRERVFDVPTKLRPGLDLRYLNDGVLPTLFVFPSDMSRVQVETNRLDNQILVHYYDREWKRWN